MEFSNLGEHCQYKYCKQLDFLPFQCEAWMMKFWKNHRRYEDHECTASRNMGKVKVSQRLINLQSDLVNFT